MKDTKELTSVLPGGFFSLPRFQKDYNEADQTTGIIGYAVIIAVFTGLFSIPRVSRLTGITPLEWLTIIGIHFLFDLFPYYTFKKLYKTPPYVLGVNILPVGLACLLIFFSGDVRSPLWAFFFLYVGVMGNVSHSNIYYSLAVFIAPLLTGVAFHANGHISDPASDWLAIFLMAILGLSLYLYAGSTNDKWRTIAAKNAELEKLVAMEKERHRIARELHDGIGSSFTNSLMILDLIGNKTSSVDGCVLHVDGLKELLNEGLVNLRDLVWAEGSENSSLGDLASYVEQKLSRLSGGNGVRIQTRIELENEDLALSPKLGLNLVRIIQEAVVNAARHAKASRIEVVIEEKAGNTRLCIRDNGVGFDANDAGCCRGNGLKNMRKRCEEMRGGIRIQSESGKGTEVSVDIARATASPLE